MASVAPVVAVVDLTPPPATPVPVPALVATALTELVDGACLLVGWSVLAGAAAGTVTFYDGTTKAGPIVAVFALAASGSSAQSIAGPGIWCKKGLSVLATQATLASVAWVRLL